jgi:hypothetical protein
VPGTFEPLGDPVAVAALVVVEDRDGDPVGLGLVVQPLHVALLRGADDVQLVLDLVGDHRALAGGQLVAGDDGVDLGQPLVGGGDVFRRVGAGPGLLVDHPAREAAARQLGVHVGPGAGDDVEAFFLGHGQHAVHVAHAAEVVDPLLRRVVAPVEIDGDGVVAAGLHLLEDVAPQVGAGHAEGVELAAPREDALAVDLQRVLVPGDLVDLQRAWPRRRARRLPSAP